jgi:hypothetical protein
MHLTTRPVRPHDAQLIAEDMRYIDRLECRCVGNHEPEEALEMGASVSLIARSIDLDGWVVGMFGVAPSSPNNTIGTPWMLATDELFTNSSARRQFLRQSIHWREEFFKYYSTLANFVHQDNWASRKWLRWLGFQFTPEVHLFRDEPFRLFYSHRQPHV